MIVERCNLDEYDHVSLYFSSRYRRDHSVRIFGRRETAFRCFGATSDAV